MAIPAVLKPRSAGEEDRSRLANLLHFETYVHRHLDWRRPLDWLGYEPYLILESGGKLLSALACPPDPPGVAWIRLFATTTRFDPGEAWASLWPQTLAELRATSVAHAAAIPLQDWFRSIIEASNFSHTYNVVVLDWQPEERAPLSDSKSSAKIRLMTEADISGVVDVDRQAFAPLWQNSKEAVKLALKQAGLATLIEEGGHILAFQISTRGSQGLHLARLATHPEHQGRGLALALVSDLQQRVLRRGENLLTVNTQDNNDPSLALYEKLGFNLTKERFPVYQYEVN